uniref:NADH-ubiquinone oxidoreductase chain 1 n=1 Tax=Kisaura zhejiangensis (nom. nud.) TaxID=2904921 RepID=A0A9E8LPS1_9NEOP|nr:NADH dehydrogenase subunit 1 [Kisaura zhejiangensis (nom. nud.)]UZZ44077.1 NADH dehydrogenase subunit 1 [Kisaura zhejiangensis (nom. nud.)]
MNMFIISMMIIVIMVLISVAFFTLLERKILGYIQIRKGPNKVGMLGILQPFSDAIKLFTKEQILLINSNYLIYYFSPVFGLMLSLLIWMLIPFMENLISMLMGFVVMLCFLSVGVYTIMISGWSSNSNYAILGSLRAVAQSISYEVSMTITMLSVIIMIFSFNLMNLMIFQKYIWFIIFMLPLGLMLFSSLLAETNRTPFDFAEGESELVSGFNIEYGSGGFAMIFLAEYSSIMFMSMLFSMMFLGGNFSMLILYIQMIFVCVMFIWVRGILPRFRYDKLMYLTWKIYLPVSLLMFIFFWGFKLIMWNFFSKN